jgi:hypothetical protein
MKITINRLAEEIKRFADEHLQLSSFYFGDFVDAVNDKEAVVYPLLVATPQPSTLTFKKANVVISFVVCDKYNEGDVFGIQQVHSDLMQIATDLRAYLRNVQDEAWLDHIEVGDTINVQPFINRGQDVTAGWVFTITFEIDDVMNYCAIPLVGSTPAPPFSCEPATVIVLNSDGTQVDGGTVASGGTGTFEAPDATAVLKNTTGTTLSTTSIASGDSEDIIAPDANLSINGQPTYVIPSGGFINEMVENTQGTPVGAFDPNSASWVVGDAGYTLDNSEGSTLFSGSIPAEDGDTIIAPDGQAVNSNASFTLSVPSGGTAPIPDSQINVNGNNEGDVVSVQPINVNLTDGTNPVTPDSVTLVGNTLTIEQGEVWWKRNPLWLPLPTVNVGDNRFVGLYAVFEDDADGNTITIDIGSGKQIDYGDGTIITSITGTNTHVYNYATISSPILQMEDGTNYKMVIVDCDITGTLGLNLNQNITGRSRRVTGWLDIVAAGSSLVGVRVSDNIVENRGFAMFLERLLILEMNTSGTPLNTELLNVLPRIKVLEYPMLNFLTNFTRLFLRSGDVRDSQGQPISINNTVFTGSLISTFDTSSITTLGDIILPNATATVQAFFNSKIQEVGNINVGSVNTLVLFFGSSQLQKVGTITVGTNLTSLDRAFQNVYNLRRLVFAGDMSSVTNTNLTFQNAWGLQELILPNLTVGFDIRATAITGTNLQDLFTSLGTASGSQTITLPTFTIGEPTTIATGKGFTIAYA